MLLGTGTPNADPDRSGSAVAIVVNEQAYLVDFGPGVIRRAAAAESQKGLEALAVQKLNRAFLTHLHSDHTLGYPDLIFSPWVLGRTEPLQVYGPVGTQHLTDHLFQAYQADIKVRLNGLAPANPTGYQVQVQEFEAGPIYADANVQVVAFAVQHGDWPAFGFRFTTPDRVIILSGDTAPFPGLAEHYQGCDILIHEVYSTVGFQTRSPVWQQYHRQFHTSTAQLAELAQQAQPKLLVLYHQLFWGQNETDLVAEIQKQYTGEVISGNDLDVF